MTDKKVLSIRILIGVAVFITLSVTIITYWKKRFSNGFRFPGLIVTVLLIIAFFTLANGVSFISEILKKDRKYLKILTGIISLMILLLSFFPQEQDSSPIIGWAAVFGLFVSSIQVSVFSTLEWARIKKKCIWFLSFLFALFSGIYSCIISAYILRGYNISFFGYVLIVYGVVLFFICLIGNLTAVASLKNEIRSDQ